MKLRTQLRDEKTGRNSRATGMRAPFLAFALFSGGCVFNPHGLPALPDTAGNDGRHDSSTSDVIRDNRIIDFSHAESPSKIDMHNDAKNDSAHKDKSVSDYGKPDSKTDIAATDAKPACLTASAGFFNGYLTSGTPQLVGGYSFDYIGKSGSDALLDISCGGAVTVSAQKCPIGLTTTINVAQDGKKITIVPVSANATVVNISITVGAI
jgi:hypothetical protein